MIHSIVAVFNLSVGNGIDKDSSDFAFHVAAEGAELTFVDPRHHLPEIGTAIRLQLLVVVEVSMVIRPVLLFVPLGSSLLHDALPNSHRSFFELLFFYSPLVFVPIECELSVLHPLFELLFAHVLRGVRIQLQPVPDVIVRNFQLLI